MQTARYNFIGNFSFSELFEIVPTTRLGSSQSMGVTAIRNKALIFSPNPGLSLLESEESIKLDANPPLVYKSGQMKKVHGVFCKGP